MEKQNNRTIAADHECRPARRFCLDAGQAKKLRKILRTAALSVALISWYTTANGLHQYVFGTLWHAYVISAALQGALFALSIQGIELLLYLSSLPKRWGLAGVWACLLVASSIFSYVYISKDVYSDRLLREDAHRVLRETCLTENYKLSDEANKLLSGSDGGTGIRAALDNYVNQLAVLEQGIDLSQDKTDDLLEERQESLLPYAYTYEEADSRQFIADCEETTNLVNRLDQIMTGKFTEQDLEMVKETADNLINMIDARKAGKETERAEAIDTRSQYQERLKTFVTTNSPDYQRLEGEVDALTVQINELNDNISDLTVERGIINEVLSILNSLNARVSVLVYQDIQELHSAVSAMTIDTGYIQGLADQIYSTLLENSVYLPKDDIRLAGYSEFQANIEKFASVVTGQQNIQNEIDALYALESVESLSADDGGDSSWVGYWQEHLNALKKSAQYLQKGGLDAEITSGLIHELEQKERLYLSDLNDFERAWGLLFGSHPYKTLLIFSVIFSFGIDLFSVLMSALLYLFKPEKPTEPKTIPPSGSKTGIAPGI